ncbi:MAG: hypothetical protein ABSG51_17290 [Terracidiphilus sp.]
MTQAVSSSTLNSSGLADAPTRAASPTNADLAALWAEARLTYPLYAQLAVQFDLAPLPYPRGEFPPPRPTRSAFDRDLKWLDAIDDVLLAYQLRQVPSEILNASESSLRAFIQRQLRKPNKSAVERDKIDWLLVQYFALCAPEEFYRQEIQLHHVARVLQPVLASEDSTPLEWCEPLDKILSHLEGCESLRDIMENGLLEQGRLLKDSAGSMFYDPAALVAFCRFNFLLRRTFIRLLHADLSATREAIETLEAKGVKTVDCRRAGFSAAETTTHLRHFCGNWKQPFQKDYTESSVTRSFEQLLALRTDLEEALARFQATGPQPLHEGAAASVQSAIPISNAAAGAASLAEESVNAQQTPPSSAPPATAAAVSKAASPGNGRLETAAASPATPTAAADADKCLESIWEQLIAAPPSRGRSMSTVILQDTKVLLSSWEVTAFVSKGSQESEDLRRAVLARALLALGMDQRKRSGDQCAMASALVLARSEVSYFQGRVEEAKRTKNTEAAVNLGISTKRLLSCIEEAEKLQP